MDKGDPSGAVVKIFDLDSNAAEKNISVESSGKFDLELNYQKEYKVSISKEGYYPKDILISTVVPSKIWQKDSIFPPFYIVVSLFQKVPDVKLSFEGKPVGKISYSPNGRLDNFDSETFINDKEIKQEIELALKNAAELNLNKLLSEALEAEKRNDFNTASQRYSEALKLKPGNTMIQEKLKLLVLKLKETQESQNRQIEFDHLMTLGDECIIRKNYEEAIINYKNALKIKPGETIALNKIKETEEAQNRIREESQSKAKFIQFIASGDEFALKKMYSESLNNYREALKINPKDSNVTLKISAVEKLMVKDREDRLKIADDIKRFLESGEKKLTDKKYYEAIQDFKAALNLKNDKQIQEKIEFTQNLMQAADAEKSQKEQEFKRLIVSGDLNASKQLYAQAIADFRAALIIKPADPDASLKLSSAEKAMASMTALKAANQLEFQQLIYQADLFSANQNYTEAINAYKKALILKPEDKSVQEKLSASQNLLTKLNAENSRIETEYKNLIANGDMNFDKRLFSEAIVDYRKAMMIKPKEVSVQAKITAAEKFLKEQNETLLVKKEEGDNTYSKNIQKGEESYSKAQWANARFYYIEALKIKPNDPYAVKKLEACDKMIEDKVTVEKIAEYQNLISRANREFFAKNYSSARFYYHNSLEILPWENLPREKLNEIDRIYTEKLSQTEHALFKENQEKADQAFNKKEFALARYYYNKANEIYQEEYNLSRLKLIDNIISGTEKNKIDAAYNDFLKKADEAFNQKNIALARYYYQKALALKPDQSYSKEQLQKLNSLK